jgi:hypothetical protein
MHHQRLTLFGTAVALLVGLLFAAGSAPARARVVGQLVQAGGAPGLISYQGYLEQADGQPFSGTATMRFAIYAAPSGGAALWEETQTGISVGAGFFTAQLGSATPLSATVFEGDARYLQVTIDLGAGEQTLPRQRLTAVPYALQAQVAASVPWSGITGAPSDLGASYENVLVVAKSGGDYTSIAAALNATVGASADNRFLVWVAPGVYTESELARVRPYVHLRGAGPNATVLTSGRSAASPGEAAASLRLEDNGRVSDITVRNTGTGSYGIGIWSSDASRGALIDGIVVESIGAGGLGHYAVYLNDSEPTIRDSRLRSSGATGFGTAVNAALGIINVSGGFPEPLVEGSVLIGGAANTDEKSCATNTGTGFAIQYINAAPLVRDSYLCGDRRGIFGGTNGVAQIVDSQVQVSDTTGAFLIETTNAAGVTLAGAGAFYGTNKHTGNGGLTCVHSYKTNYTAASDGVTPATACN